MTKLWIIFSVTNGAAVLTSQWDEDAVDRGLPRLGYSHEHVAILADYDTGSAEWVPDVGPAPIFEMAITKETTYPTIWAAFDKWTNRGLDEELTKLEPAWCVIGDKSTSSASITRTWFDSPKKAIDHAKMLIERQSDGRLKNLWVVKTHALVEMVVKPTRVKWVVS